VVQDLMIDETQVQWVKTQVVGLSGYGSSGDIMHFELTMFMSQQIKDFRLLMKFS
jgi:hypothetical protein